MSEGNLYSSEEKKKVRAGLKRFLNAKVKNIYFKRQLEGIWVGSDKNHSGTVER